MLRAVVAQSRPSGTPSERKAAPGVKQTLGASRGRGGKALRVAQLTATKANTSAVAEIEAALGIMPLYRTDALYGVARVWR